MDTLFEEYKDIIVASFVDTARVLKLKKWECLPRPKVKRGITNERQGVMKDIQIEMEKEGPVNVKLLAIKLSHIPTNDLYFMLSEARDYRNRGKGEFGKYIYGSIKIKKS